MTATSRGTKDQVCAVLLLIGIWPATACSLSLEDYRIADPAATGAGGAAAIDVSGSDASAGTEGAAAPTSLDNGGLGGSAGGAGSTGATGGAGGVPPSDTPASWDSRDTLWDTATWN